jgi:Tfp pilus assembly protein PilO
MPNKPRSLYDRRRAVWGALLGVLALDAALVFFTLRPSGLSMAQQKAELARLNADLKTRRDSLAHLEHIQAMLSDSGRQGEEFLKTKFLPAETGFSTIMEEVDKLAVSNGVRKGGVSYSNAAVKDRPGIEAITIDTSLEGEYSKIVRFINRLEQSQLFLIVDSLAVGQSSGRGAVKLSVRLVTYFRVPKAFAE